MQKPHERINVNSEHLTRLLYQIELSLLFLPLTRCSSWNGTLIAPIRFFWIIDINMSAHHLSSLKWSDEGELSPQDTWNLVTKLTKTEDQSKASNLLHLSSKHSHAKSKTTHKKWAPERRPILLSSNWGSSSPFNTFAVVEGRRYFFNKSPKDRQIHCHCELLFLPPHRFWKPYSSRYHHQKLDNQFKLANKLIEIKINT